MDYSCSIGAKVKGFLKFEEIWGRFSMILGDKYTETSPDRFVSSDNTRVFRMTDADILGKHAGAPHVHFEIMAPNPNPLKFGKPKVIINKHIYIK